MCSALLLGVRLRGYRVVPRGFRAITRLLPRTVRSTKARPLLAAGGLRAAKGAMQLAGPKRDSAGVARTRANYARGQCD